MFRKLAEILSIVDTSWFSEKVGQGYVHKMLICGVGGGLLRELS